MPIFAVFKAAGVDSLRFGPRVVIWLPGTAVMYVAASSGSGWIARLGVAAPTWRTLITGVVGGFVMLGSVWWAALVSVVAFTIAHYRWGLSHLLSVFWTGATLTALYVYSGDLLACVFAHAIVDTVGLLLMPAIKAKCGVARARAAGG